MWIIYSDDERLLKEYSEEIMINNVRARALTIEAEAAVSAAHAIYMEHMFFDSLFNNMEMTEQEGVGHSI
jgi:hypothetical protein